MILKNHCTKHLHYEKNKNRVLYYAYLNHFKSFDINKAPDMKKNKPEPGFV